MFKELFHFINNPEKVKEVKKTDNSDVKGIDDSQATHDAPIASVPEKKEPAELIQGAFAKFAISQDDLLNLEEYKQLSDGQKLLVARNLSQLVLGRIQSEASDEYKSGFQGSQSQKSGFWSLKNDWADTKEHTRVMLGNVWRAVSKKYQIAKIEQAKADEFEKGGLATHQPVLKQLINGVAKNGPDAEIKDNGELEIKFVRVPDQADDNEKIVIGSFNEAAALFSHIPDEWGYESALPAEKKRFAAAKLKYDQAREKYLEVLSHRHRLKGQEELTLTDEENVTEEIANNKNKADTAALLDLNEVDAKVQMSRFLHTHPEAEEELLKIKDEDVLKKAFANIITERGIYAGAGWLTRTVSMSILGAVAVPLAAAGMGGLMARKRAIESLRENDKSGRSKKIVSNKKEKEPSELPYSEVKKVTKKMNNLSLIAFAEKKVSEEINEDESDEKYYKRKKALQNSLKLHINWVEDKIAKGMINYGSGDERIKNQYNLLSTYSQAKMISDSLEFFDFERDDGKQVKVEQRYQGAIKKRDETISQSRRRFVLKQTMKGAAIGAGFAYAGWLARGIVMGGKHQAGWLDKAGEAKSNAGSGSTNNVVSVNSTTTDDQSNVAQSISADDLNLKAKSLWSPRYDIYDGIHKSVVPDAKLPEPSLSFNPEESVKIENFDWSAPDERIDAQKDIIENAIIRKGEGIEHALIRQLQADPQSFGYKGDLEDPAAIKKWAGGEAHRLAIQNNFIDEANKTELRIGAKGIDKTAYVLEQNANGKPAVQVYYEKNGQFKKLLQPNDYQHTYTYTNENVIATSNQKQINIVDNKNFLTEANDPKLAEFLQNSTADKLNSEVINKINTQHKYANKFFGSYNYLKSSNIDFEMAKFAKVFDSYSSSKLNFSEQQREGLISLFFVKQNQTEVFHQEILKLFNIDQYFFNKYLTGNKMMLFKLGDSNENIKIYYGQTQPSFQQSLTFMPDGKIIMTVPSRNNIPVEDHEIADILKIYITNITNNSNTENTIIISL